MCGIAGIFSYRAQSVDVGELFRMRDHMASRGPDGAGIWQDDETGIGLAHRRLAILDLTENGAQPMSTADGQLRIVFKGKIYNHGELRDRLEAKGHVFFSGSDTEVLLHAYREYGEAKVDRLRGMFAFAIWDDSKPGVFLACDHFGIKPLIRLDEWLKPVSSAYAKVAAMEMSLYMRNMLLRDSDWVGMARSLEIRTPMVDIGLFRALAPCLSDPVNQPVKTMLWGAPARRAGEHHRIFRPLAEAQAWVMR
ncbi:MAG TPA: hypothetical protein VFF26_12615 [Gallionella sp.]|nr:hypothetical protein [Gallionella sp.]